MTWLSRCSSPCLLWRTSPPLSCSSCRHFRSSPAPLVSNWFYSGSTKAVEEEIFQTCQSKRWPPSLEKVEKVISQEHKSSYYWRTIRKTVILSVLESVSAGQCLFFFNHQSHLFNCISFSFNHRFELCVNTECTRSRDDLSPHERTRPVRSGPVLLLRNPLEPAGERQQKGGHCSAQQHGVCRVRVSFRFEMLSNVAD